MRARSFVLSLAVASLALLTGGWWSRPSASPKVTSPADGAVVQAASFTVEVRVPRSYRFDPATGVLLNSVPLPMTKTRRGVYTATVEAGPLLQDENTLVLTARKSGKGKGKDGHGDRDRDRRGHDDDDWDRDRRGHYDGDEDRDEGRKGKGRRKHRDQVVVTSHFQWLMPKARAFQVSDAADLIDGPLAHGAVGDYMIDNGFARFVIQNAGQRDLYSVGAFGGNLIDLAPGSGPGLDNFLEIAPMLNIETVVNPVPPVEVVNDGQDGLAAVLRTCGPDDLLDFVNPSSQVAGAGLTFPPAADDRNQNIEACTEFSLEPGKSHLKMVTTVENLGPTALRLFVGDWINASGELDFWGTPGQGLGAALFSELSTISFIGFDEAAGVDYSYTSIATQDGVGPPETSNFFSTSGVTVVLNNMDILAALLIPGTQPPFLVPAGGSNSFTRYVGVGDGSGSNGIDIENEVLARTTGTLAGCVRVGDEPAPGARVAVGTDLLDPDAQAVHSVFTTGDDGCFSGTLPVGSYQAAAARAATPYEGNGSVPAVKDAPIAAGATTTLSFELPATGRLRVEIVDETRSRMPGRVAVVGFDPSPEPLIPGATLIGFGGSDIGLFQDPGDSLPFGIVAVQYADARGVAELEVEPGSYQVFVSRGTEYSLYQTPVDVEAGENRTVRARLARVIDTPGFVSSDFHVHGINSADSRVSHRKRVFQFAGEGVENVVMTDHHSHTDLLPTIAALSMQDFLTSTVGEEITTFDYGHFNAYPLGIDPTRPSGGSTDWGRAAPPGMDFPSLGAFNAAPPLIAALATTPGLNPLALPETVIQINHIDSHFEPLEIDTSREPPLSGLTGVEKMALRLNPVVTSLFARFDGLELWNGDNRGDQGQFLDERIGIWFNHLNQGLFTTAISDTDTHTFTNLNTAGARSWTAAPSDDVAGIAGTDVATSVAAGRVVGGQGVYVQTRLLAQDGSGGVADLTLAGSTLVASANGMVDLEIHVQAPSWAPYDRIEIYANAATTRAGNNYLYGAVPTRTLVAGVDFAVDEVNVFPRVAGATRFETLHTESFALGEDTWFVVVVRGTDGVSAPMFPVYPDNLAQSGNTTLAALLDGNLGESGVTALGVTNALLADVDGGGFDPPGVRLAP